MKTSASIKPPARTRSRQLSGNNNKETHRKSSLQRNSSIQRMKETAYTNNARHSSSRASEFDDDRIISALATRSFHLPGNTTWWEDWRQYFRNNHPILGLCMYHPLHPVRLKMRLVMLMGSVVFGLAVTNVVWLYFHYQGDETYVLLTLGASGASLNSNSNETNTVTNDASDTSLIMTTTFPVTKAAMVLWTLGTTLHASFDCTVWFFAACVCCLPGQCWSHYEKYRGVGAVLVIVATLIFTVLSTLAVVSRAVIRQSEEESQGSTGMTTTTTGGGASLPSTGGLLDDEIDLVRDTPRDLSAYDFLAGYAVELALALLVFNPLVGTILFSGILGCCGRIPVLGGRPYELAVEEKKRRDEEAAGF